ncbi:beta-lactamase-like protein [Flagelloscypha sp. PMI_526]|nr:beta-lactamase-like protein [Flagelloscypha sp. PMI_526]
MDKLEALAPITRLSSHVLRVLGMNPGKFTLQGTNTYILGSKNPFILVDTGEAGTSPAYISNLRQAFTNPTLTPWTQQDKPLVSHILISHWHHDHVGGLPSVLALLRELNGEQRPFQAPAIHKFPLPTPLEDRPEETLKQLPTLARSFPDLSEGQVFPLTSDEGATVQVIHIPGHTKDSVALLLPSDKALYTSDTVLGAGTAVFEDLGTYIRSLRRMLSTEGYTILYPGHGPVVSNGKETIEMYINHRLERENQVMAELNKPPPPSSPGHWTTWSLVKSIYASYPESLWLPAAHGLNLHLKKLCEEGKVKLVDGEGVDCRWEVIKA